MVYASTVSCDQAAGVNGNKPVGVLGGMRAVRTVFANRVARDAQLALALARAIDLAQLVVVSAFLFGHGGADVVATYAVVRTLVPAVGVPVVTAFGWRLGPGRLLALMGACAAIGSLAMAAVVLSGAPTPGLLCAAGAVGIALGCFRPVICAALPALERSPGELIASNAATGFLDGASTLVGPVLGGLIGSLGGVPALLAVSGAGAFAAGLLALRLPRAAGIGLLHHTGGRSRRVADYTTGARELATVPAARLVTLMGAAQTTVRGALNVIVVVFAIENLTGPSWVGGLYGATGVGGLVSVPLAVIVVSRFGVHRSLGIGLATWGAPLVICALVTSPAVAVLLFAATGLGNGLIDISYYSVMQRSIDAPSLARVLGVAEAVLQGGIAVGAFAGAVLVAHLGSRLALVVTGLVLPVVAVSAGRRLAAFDSDLRQRDRKIALLRRLPSFAPLPMSALDQVADGMTRVWFAAGQVITFAGEHSGAYLVVEDGTVEITDGCRTRVLVGPGQGCGDLALASGAARTATVSARSLVRAHAIEPSAFLAAIDAHPAARVAAEQEAAVYRR